MKVKLGMFKKLFAKKPLSKVTIRESDVTFEVGRNETVLEAALKAGIAYPHDCTVGTCGSCRSKMLSGKVDAITPFGYTLSREELLAGYILACQAVPESDLELSVPIAAAPARKLTATIAGQQELTHDIRLVSWDLSEPLTYNAGQYMTLQWAGGAGPRSYSFSTPPVTGGRQQVATFIRRVPGGAFTDQLFAGDLATVEFAVEAPHGTFWLRDGTGPIVLVGGGSGLAPLMSLLEDAIERGVTRDAVLLFGGRAERDLYCLAEIEAVAARWHGRFDFRPVLSEQPSPGRRSGFVTAEIPAVLTEFGDAQTVQGYLCGPPPMIDVGVAALVAGGVPIDAIFYDKFTDASTGTK